MDEPFFLDTMDNYLKGNFYYYNEFITTFPGMYYNI
jgi:hypothetical protein